MQMMQYVQSDLFYLTLKLSDFYVRQQMQCSMNVTQDKRIMGVFFRQCRLITAP